MYNVEVFGNGIYVGKVIPYPDGTEFFPIKADSAYPPVFTTKKHLNYWDAYDEAEEFVKAANAALQNPL